LKNGGLAEKAGRGERMPEKLKMKGENEEWHKVLYFSLQR
jgi:hypothetical protein